MTHLMENFSSTMKIGLAISDLRKRKGFQQKPFALLCGINQGYLSQVESGKREPSQSALEKIAAVLSVPLPLIYLHAAGPEDIKGPEYLALVKEIDELFLHHTVLSATREKKGRIPTYITKLLGMPRDTILEIASTAASYYHPFEQPKTDKRGNPVLQNGKPKLRKLHSVGEPLRFVQDKIKENILSVIDFPDALYGGIKGKNNILNAKRHLGKKFAFITDIKDFYPSIKPKMVYDVFVKLGHPPNAARILTFLTTVGGELPQGSPTSSYLANLAFIETDVLLLDFCRRHRLTYTRYVDDLTFSSSQDFKKHSYEIVSIISRSGFHINHRKTAYKVGPIEITGIIRRNNSLSVPEYVMEKMNEHGRGDRSREGLARYATRVNEKNSAAQKTLAATKKRKQ